VPVPSPGTITTKLILSGDTLLEFASGSFTSIAALAPCRSPATPRVADAGNTNISGALSLLGSNAGDFELHSGAAGPRNHHYPGVDFGNAGTFNIDTINFGFGNAEGGSSLILGGVLTNNAGKTITVGNNALTATSTLAAAGLNNLGTVRLQGSGTNHAVLNVTAGALTNSGALEVHENVVLTTALRRQFDQHRDIQCRHRRLWLWQRRGRQHGNSGWGAEQPDPQHRQR